MLQFAQEAMQTGWRGQGWPWEQKLWPHPRDQQLVQWGEGSRRWLTKSSECLTKSLNFIPLLKAHH